MKIKIQWNTIFPLIVACNVWKHEFKNPRINAICRNHENWCQGIKPYRIFFLIWERSLVFFFLFKEWLSQWFFFFTILVLLVEIMFGKLNGISFALIPIQFYNIGTDGKMCVLINYMIFPLHWQEFIFTILVLMIQMLR